MPRVGLFFAAKGQGRTVVIGQVRMGFFLTVAFSLLVPAGAAAQEATPTSPSANTKGQESAAAKKEKKPTLAEVTRVSTAEAVRSAAKARAKTEAQTKEPDKPGEPDVSEFQPASGNADASANTATAASHDSRKSALKNVHGTVHGSLDPKNTGSRRVGASVGGGSKSGKSHIHVETDRSRRDRSSPH